MLVSPDLCLYIGLDLAWSPRNLSGGAVIQSRSLAQGGQLIDVALLDTNDAILSYVQRFAQNVQSLGLQIWIGVDAPLRVPNLTGRRQAEAQISQAFRVYHAGAHPANRQLLMRDGVVRGEVLVAGLQALGIPHKTQFEPGSHAVVEVFPHPAMVTLFELAKVLPYKAKPKRDWATRLGAWRQYQQHLAALKTADPPLTGIDDLVSQDVETLKGKKLKNYEDQMDAVICAYIALYAHRWGSKRCRVFGTLADGSIFTPVPLHLRPDGS